MGCGKIDGFERARLQPCRKVRMMNSALAAEGWFFNPLNTNSFTTTRQA
jgi:hypothetical protein